MPSSPDIPKGCPHFLIIGACKAGTTTMYDDLAMHPAAHMPSDKEPDILHRAKDAAEAVQMWQRHFAGAPNGAICGEGSTYYTMTPEWDGVAQKAREALGGDARIIYLVRDPVRRIESHLSHDIAAGRITASQVEQAALNESRYVSWSDYARQVTPWIEAFGQDKVKIIVFEDFVADRYEVAKQAALFVGLDPYTLPERETVSNAREELRTMRFSWLGDTLFKTNYRQRLRKLVPGWLLSALRQRLTKPANTDKVALADETVAELRRRLAHVKPELEALGVDLARWQ